MNNCFEEKTAIIDIGSNSIRYMLCEKHGGDVIFNTKRLATTRLAEGIIKSGTLSRGAITRSIEALRDYISCAEKDGAVVYAYATSAVRDTLNRDDFLQTVKQELGLDIDVLSGTREAEYALLGACASTDMSGLIDIGGGSFQIIAEGFAASYPLGCVRTKELCENYPQNPQALQQKIEQEFACGVRFPGIYIPNWVGVGGTITTLAALSLNLKSYDACAVRSTILHLNTVDALIDTLYGMGESRKAHPLLSKRHDVIIFGAIVLKLIMRGMSIDKITVSDADGMEGYYGYIEHNLKG